MRKLLVFLLCLLLPLCGCGLQPPTGQKQYTATFLELFDTVTTVVGAADSEAAFQAKVQPLREELEHYHKLFDIYEEYPGLNNLKTVNDHAAEAPVTVDGAILDLLQDCQTYFRATGGVFNPAMGSVLRLWHEAREGGINDPANAYLPDAGDLQAAARHTDPAAIVLDQEASTVFLADPALQLDVGGIAKGWAVQRVCQNAPVGLLVSVGGNVYATGPKAGENVPWAVGVTDPSGEEEYLHVLNITGGSVVTSGNYQRTYTVDGKAYHHIIDPATLYPGERWAAVTVVCADSGLADVLSTSLFLLDREAGQALLDNHQAEALWVKTDGTICYSPGFREYIRN